MKLSRSLLVLSSLTFIGAVAAASGACSSTPATVTLTAPPGLIVGLPPGVTYSSWGLDATCTAGDYVAETTNLGTCTGTIYVLCDDGTWDDYSCDDPSGTGGWTEGTGSGSGTGDGGPGPDGGDASTTIDGGQAHDGGGDAAPTDAAPASDGGQGDAMAATG